MATVNYSLKYKTNPASIYVRFVNGRALSIPPRTTGLVINPEYWDAKKQKIRDVAAVHNRHEINSNLAKLKSFILDEFNSSYMKGEIINGHWVDQKVNEFFNRPKHEVKKVNLDHHIYLTDFAFWWLENKADKWKSSESKYMDLRSKQNYKSAAELFCEFQKSKKVLLKNLFVEVKSNKSETTSVNVFDAFSEHLIALKYSKSTAIKITKRMKFFCKRAESEKLEVDQIYKERVFVVKNEAEYLEPYLNESEIKKLFYHDFSYNETLDNVRDNFIIGLCTGLRVSDFLTRLSIDNIDGEFITIKTKKTKKDVAIPIHPYVRMILEKRKGQLPNKISEQKFNMHIKRICQVLDFDEEMIGGIAKVNPITKEKRKVVGLYKKYLLVSSHICRRSFATNHFGKLANHVIMGITGHTTETEFLKYIKTTSKENALLLQEHWENKKIN